MSELMVIHCPLVPVIISLGPHNDRHVGQELRGLVWKSGCQDGSHDGKLLDPDRDVGDPGRVGRWPAIGAVRSLSMQSSAISTNSRSNVLLTSFKGREAVGL